MKNILVSFFVMALGLAAYAPNALALGSSPPSDGGPQTHPGRHGGLITCAASDDGMEEHYGGHASCSACLAEHGHCTERCYTAEFKCTAQGNDRSGLLETFEAYSDNSEYDARDQALDRCYRSGGSNCSIQTCNEDQSLESSNTCERNEPDHDDHFDIQPGNPGNNGGGRPGRGGRNGGGGGGRGGRH